MVYSEKESCELLMSDELPDYLVGCGDYVFDCFDFRIFTPKKERSTFHDFGEIV